MPFYAINSYEEDLLDQAKQHTLELQLEQGLKIFEEALQAQKAQNFDRAHGLYSKLFGLEVLQLKHQKRIPPSAFRLKSLALKNNALLLLEELHKDYNTIETKDQLFYRLGPIAENLVEALECNQQDTQIQEILTALALEFGETRLARLAMESIVLCEDDRPVSVAEAAATGYSLSGFSPRDINFLAQLFQIVKKIQDSYALESDFYKTLESVQSSRKSRDFSWLNSKFDIKDGLKALLEYYSSADVELEIMLTTQDWHSILAGLEEAPIATTRKRRRAVADSYSYSDRSIDRLKFVAPHGDPRLLVPSESQMLVDSEAETDVEMIDNEPSETPAPIEAKLDESAVTDLAPKESGPEPAVVEMSQTDLVRSSKRVKAQAPENTVAADFGQQDKVFADQIVSYLDPIKLQFKSVVPIYLNESERSEDDLAYEDFKQILAEWDEDKIGMFLRSGVPEIGESQPIMQLLDFAALGTASEVTHAPYEVDRKEVSTFLSQIEDGAHIQQVRIDLLKSLLCSLSGHVPKLLVEFWPSELVDGIWKLVSYLEDKIYALARNEISVDAADMVLVIYEMHVDRYLTLDRDLRSKTTNAKSIEQKETDLSEALLRWRGAAGDALALLQDMSERTNIMRIRFQWVSIFYDQIHADSPEVSMTKFEAVRDFITQNFSDLNIEYPSLENIPTLSSVSAETQISKYRAASIFARAFKREGDKDIVQSISLLESMLMPEVYHTEIPEHLAISQFLSSASNDFRLNLWYLLLENYEQVGEKRKSLDGLVRILDSSLAEIGDETYRSEPPHKRQTVLLKTLSVSHDVAKRLLPLLVENEEILEATTPQDAQNMLVLIVKVLQLIHIFMLNDQAINSNIIQAPQAFSWERAAAKFRELSVYWWCIFYLYYRSALLPESRTPEILNDLLSIIHEQLGVQGYCGLADGSLLKLNLKEIVRMDWNESEADMIQCLHCRYGLSLFNEYFQPYNHHSATEEMTQEDAVQLCRFVTRMLLSKKNPTQFLIRAEIRQAIDTINEALGTPDNTLNQIRINTEILDRFLNHSDITSSLLKAGWTGQLQLSMQPSNDPKAKAAGQGGIYFVMGVVTLIQFRMRKRANAARVEDLHDAIKYFRDDLICCTDRFESWFGLSQAYDYLAEESLIWSSDSLIEASPIYNEIILNRGRALLSCTMAISSLLKGTSHSLSIDYAKTVEAQVWSLYGRLLLYAASSPQKMVVFGKRSTQKYVFVNGEYTDSKFTAIKEQTVLRLADSSLMVARTTSPRDWFTWYLSAKVAYRLNRPPREVLDNFAKSIQLRASGERESRNQDIPAVATQSLVSLASRYSIDGKLTAEEGVQYLGLSATVPKSAISEALEKVKAGVPGKQVISDLTIQCFSNLIASDKRHWLHRPYYWLAKHYDNDLKDKAKAEEVLREMFTRGSNSKTPLHIWTSEYERPGQHFVYVHDYIVYYSDLLYENKMESALNSLARRLRRFSSRMTDHLSAWKHVCSLSVKLALEILGFPPRYSDRVLPNLEWSEFEARGQQLEKWISAQQSSPQLDSWILALEYAVDLRRLNNGYGATTYVDELVISIYLRLMEIFTTTPPVSSDVTQPEKPDSTPNAKPNAPEPEANINGNNSTNNGDSKPSKSDPKPEKKRRVIRRDVLQQCQHMLKPLQPRLSKLDQRTVPRELHKYVDTMTPEPIQPSPSKSPSRPLNLNMKDETPMSTASPESQGPQLVAVSLFPPANHQLPPQTD